MLALQQVAGTQPFLNFATTVAAANVTQTLTPEAATSSVASLVELAGRLKAAGDLRGAVEKYYDALRLDPNNVTAQISLGSLFLATGDLQRALEHSERAYQLDPRNAEAMNNLGQICRTQGSFETAAQWYRAAVRVNPNLEVAAQGLAISLVSYGLQVKAQSPKTAIKCYREALIHAPTNSNAYYNLGVLYAELGKHDKALINYNLTVHFDPTCAEAYNNMGVIYKEQENLEKALKCYHLALQCNPRFAQTLNNLGVAYTTIGRLTEALEHLSRAVAVAPNYAEAYNNLGWLFWDHGDLAQALRMYERCIELSPNSKNPGQNRLLALNYLPNVDPDRVFQAHCAWSERFCSELGPAFTDWPVTRTTNRRLKVAYISPDYFHHSVSFFCHALFQYHNRDLFEVFIYSSAVREDEKTELFKTLVPESHWRKVTGRPAREVAEMIRADQIDILVELAGHTANNRLDVAALKPAPVQFTYIGYNNTTGLGAIDYRITDGVVDPPTSAQKFSEELVRLPGCFLCYTPPARIPDVGTLPALKNGFVTFGSFSCLAKVTNPCVALWARVLREVPNSRLLVKNKGFYSNDVQQTFINKFKAHGIGEHRLKLLSLAPTSFEHLNIYNDVDIALDTFPYSNTTTSCETLLMGVPVVCLAGNTHGSRVGMTLLSAIGLTDFIAASEEDYVMKAKTAAGNLPALATLRSNLRQVLLSSQLCDGAGFVRDKYEPVLLEKWRLFCEGRPPSAQVFSGPEAPDALAPGPFAPPLAPGQPLVSPPPSSPATVVSSLATPATAPLPAISPLAVPLLAGHAPMQLQPPLTTAACMNVLGQVVPLAQMAHQPLGTTGIANLAAVAQLAAAAQPQQIVHPQPMVISAPDAVVRAASPPLLARPVTPATLASGVAHVNGVPATAMTPQVVTTTTTNPNLLSGVHPICTGNYGLMAGLQAGRRRQRARPQGRRL